jgi:hypothetical protein
MEGCGPCGEVRPEWEKIYEDKPFLNTLDPRVVMADIDHTVLANKDLLKDPPSAFPNIRKVISISSSTSNPSKQMYEEYNGPRTSEDIKNWIKTSLKSSLGKKSLGRRSSSDNISSLKSSLGKRSSLSNKSPSFHSLSHSSNSSSHPLSNRHNSNSLRGGSSSIKSGSSSIKGGSLFKFRGASSLKKSKRRKNKKSKKNK